MAPQKVKVIEVRVVFATPESNAAHIEGIIMSRLTDTLAHIRNAEVSAGFFDGEGRRIRRIEFTESSPEMRKVADYELGTEEAVGA